MTRVFIRNSTCPAAVKKKKHYIHLFPVSMITSVETDTYEQELSRSSPTLIGSTTDGRQRSLVHDHATLDQYKNKASAFPTRHASCNCHGVRVANMSDFVGPSIFSTRPALNSVYYCFWWEPLRLAELLLLLLLF